MTDITSTIDTKKMFFGILEAPNTVYDKDNELASKHFQD